MGRGLGLGGGGSLTRGGGRRFEWCLVEESGLQLIIPPWRNLQTVISHHINQGTPRNHTLAIWVNIFQREIAMEICI